MFSFLTEPNYPRAALGLDRDAVTAVALDKAGRGRYGIKQAATVALPNDLLNPSFLDRNISSPDELRVLLEEVVAGAGLTKQTRWSVSLPSTTARTAILVMDNEPASKQELEDMLDWKAEQSFGAPADQLRISRNKITTDAEGRSRYFATAVKLSVIDEYETIFEGLGWKAGLILPRAVSEANWLSSRSRIGDTLLISSHIDGFTAMLLRDGEPVVVRTVICTEDERDDEIYRLLMFYNDRVAGEGSGILESLLVIGRAISPARIKEISSEALGRALRVMTPDDIGLELPISSLTLDEVAAPAGLAALGWR